MLRIKSIVDGQFCWFMEREFNQTWNQNYKNYICPMCNLKINLGDRFYMIINNDKLFPNVHIHKSCIHNDMTLTTRILMNKYTTYTSELIELQTKNKGWNNE